MPAASSPDATIAGTSWPGPAGTTLGGGWYSATCSSPDSTQVTRLRSTPYSSARMPRAHTPVVTV